MKQMNVVLDASIIVADFYLRGPEAQVLERFLQLGLISLWIPQVVIDETVAKYSDSLDDLVVSL